MGVLLLLPPLWLRGENFIMPIEYDTWQALVDCEGDINITLFYPPHNDGKAILLLRQGVPGEPGRTLTDEELPEKLGQKVDFAKTPGVYIRAGDWRSLDAIIHALTHLRDSLMPTFGDSVEAEIVRRVGQRMVEDIQRETDEAILRDLEKQVEE